MQAEHVVVHDNHVHENGCAGIVLRDGANPLLAKNRCIDNAAEGVKMDEASLTGEPEPVRFRVHSSAHLRHMPPWPHSISTASHGASQQIQHVFSSAQEIWFQ